MCAIVVISSTTPLQDKKKCNVCVFQYLFSLVYVFSWLKNYASFTVVPLVFDVQILVVIALISNYFEMLEVLSP